MNITKVVCTVTLILMLGVVSPLLLQAEDKAPFGLSQYMKPHTLTEMDYLLIQFNIVWNGYLSPPQYYVRSYPVSFSLERMTFICHFTISNKRTQTDTKPFLGMQRSEQRSVLEETIEGLVIMLKQDFPEIDKTLFEARYSLTANGKSRDFAVYIKGKLIFLD